MYCKKCGGKLESYASNCAFCGTPVEKYDTNVSYTKQEKKLDYEPMTTKKWIGLTLLNCLPGIGQIIYLALLFRWAFGSTKDLTLKGFAKANLILLLVATILTVVIIAFLPETLTSLQK